MPPKRKVAPPTQAPVTPNTRKAPTRGASAGTNKLVELESEPETIETTELEDDIEDNEDKAPKRRRVAGSKQQPPPSSSLASLLPPPQRPAAGKTATTSKTRGRAGRAGKASKVNAKDGESGTEDDLGGAIGKEQEVGGEIIMEGRLRKEKTQPPRRIRQNKLTKKERDALEIAETQYTPVRVEKETVVEVDGEEEARVEGGTDDEDSIQASHKPKPRKREASPMQHSLVKRLNPHSKSLVDGTQGNGSLVEAALQKQIEEMTRRFHETDKRLKELIKLKMTDAEVALVKYKEVMEARIASIPPLPFRSWCYRGLILTIHLQQPLKISLKPCKPISMPTLLFRPRTSHYKSSSHLKITSLTPSILASWSLRRPSRLHTRRNRPSSLNSSPHVTPQVISRVLPGLWPSNPPPPRAVNNRTSMATSTNLVEPAVRAYCHGRRWRRKIFTGT